MSLWRVAAPTTDSPPLVGFIADDAFAGPSSPGRVHQDLAQLLARTDDPTENGGEVALHVGEVVLRAPEDALENGALRDVGLAGLGVQDGLGLQDLAEELEALRAGVRHEDLVVGDDGLDALLDLFRRADELVGRFRDTSGSRDVGRVGLLEILVEVCERIPQLRH